MIVEQMHFLEFKDLLIIQEFLKKEYIRLLCQNNLRVHLQWQSPYATDSISYTLGKSHFEVEQIIKIGSVPLLPK